MALDRGDTTITLLNLYRCSVKAGISGIKRRNKIQASINGGGTADIYGLTSATEPANLSDMDLPAENTGVKGIIPFEAVPMYIAVKQNAATVSEVIFTGIEATFVKTIT